MKISNTNNKDMITNPLIPNHEACKLFFPCTRSSPKEADPTGKPKPRKSNEVRAIMDELIKKVISIWWIQLNWVTHA